MTSICCPGEMFIVDPSGAFKEKSTIFVLSVKLFKRYF